MRDTTSPAPSRARASTSAVQRGRPAFGAGPTAATTSAGTARPMPIRRDSWVFSTAKAAMMVARSKPRSSSAIANRARSI